MNAIKSLFIQLIKLLIFWILLFDFQRIMFSIHNWGKFSDVSWGDWFLTFFYSIRLDLATAGFLSVLPLLFLIIYFAHPKKWLKRLFIGVLLLEAVITIFIHAGEINAYPEWNHKLTSRVFTHLSNPDEVFRTADYGMTIGFIVFSILEIVFAWRISQWLFKKLEVKQDLKILVRIPVSILLFSVFSFLFLLLARGGWQQIPININSAFFSNNPVANDLATNSTYYFGKSYLLYNRSEIDDLMPDINPKEAKRIVDKMYNYPKEHDVKVLENERPNVVFIVLEGWASEAIGSLGETKGATPNFDALTKEGLLFSNIYATGGTSEIGNSSIFSGNPAIPEISISLQPDKSRKLHSINQDMQEWGYSSNYIFSGDLKYGNIGGYFLDHGFDDVADESDFPSGLKRGKLNYFDEDLYDFLIERTNATQEPFLHCAFTGSTHSPYDYPKKGKQKFKGVEADYMNSVVYADGALKAFIEKCKKQSWYKNTLFVFIADHGHATPSSQSPSFNKYNRIPLLFYGEPLKAEYKGKRIEKIGSQSDVAATLIYQMNGDISRYPWSKDLLNPNSPEFACHTITRGYGWVTPLGGMTFQMEMKSFLENTFPKNVEKTEVKKGHAFLTQIYADYKAL